MRWGSELRRFFLPEWDGFSVFMLAFAFLVLGLFDASLRELALDMFVSSVWMAGLGLMFCAGLFIALKGAVVRPRMWETAFLLVFALLLQGFAGLLAAVVCLA
ncbi:MAG: hypothetical protein HC945_02685 [Nitrosarchaeum sp.]|nr:hypothetical protein [Nitrosarchaeum sp.]